jgi:hypothetical protein
MALRLGNTEELERQLHVVQSGAPRQQPILLKHGGDPAAEMREIGVGCSSANHNRSGGRLLKPDHQVEESGFAATGLADNGHHLAGRDIEIEMLDRHHGVARRRLPENLAQLPDLDWRRPHHPRHRKTRRSTPVTTASRRNNRATRTSVQAKTSATENNSCATAS